MAHVNLKKIDLENDGIFNFAVSQEKWVKNIFKKLVASNNMFEEMRKSLKLAETKQIMYGLCKVCI